MSTMEVIEWHSRSEWCAVSCQPWRSQHGTPEVSGVQRHVNHGGHSMALQKWVVCSVMSTMEVTAWHSRRKHPISPLKVKPCRLVQQEEPTNQPISHDSRPNAWQRTSSPESSLGGGVPSSKSSSSSVASSFVADSVEFLLARFAADFCRQRNETHLNHTLLFTPRQPVWLHQGEPQPQIKEHKLNDKNQMIQLPEWLSLLFKSCGLWSFLETLPATTVN